MTTELETLRQDNTGLRRENQALLRNRTQIEANVATRVKRELLGREKDAVNRARIDTGVLSSLTARVDKLAASLNEARANDKAGDLRVGVGLDGVGDTVVWIKPLDALDDEVGGGLLRRAKNASGGLLDTARSGTASAVGGIEDRLEDLKPKPVYTVPRNATLIGSTAMTALVGRVPIQGQVRDPMPFKVITGADNLAANGLRVPGVQGMVWSGTAIGD
ncbi:MAG: TIGR03752 family integrating conjugative element protein, partial [Actinomycetia bacterium]|nr:TIGR03752 family integrating conjugative element protein [Actinomycetes bacterium]